MNKTFIIIRREYLKRVQKKSFILLTLLMPFLMVAIVVVPLWLASIQDDKLQNIAVVDNSGRYAEALKDTPTYHFVRVPSILPEMRSDTSAYEAVISVTGDLSTDRGALTIYSRKEVSVGLLGYVQAVVNEQVRKDRLAASGVPQIDKILAEVQKEVNVQTVKWNEKGDETSSDSNVAIGAGFVFTLLIYMFVMIYGAMVMQSVIEEKTNRIVELMVSSVKPFQLMMGKIVGIALVGFTQLLVWAAMMATLIPVAVTLFNVDASATQVQLLSALANLPYVEIGVMFLLMFIGGYLLYASFLAAVGASVNEQEDSSQFMLPITLIMVFGLYAAMYSVENTDGPLAFWTSLIPLTSPIVMMVRIPFGVPLWQELLSLALLYGFAVGMIWVGAKIYRVGILMYGKKPSIAEMLKWIRYK